MALLDAMAAEGTISQGDRHRLLVTDDLDEAMTHLRVNAVERFGLRHVFTPSPLLGEPKPLAS